MFIPIGFGQFLRKFPFVILLIAVSSFILSSNYNPVLERINKSVDVKETLKINELMSATRMARCTKILGLDESCKYYCQSKECKKSIWVKGKNVQPLLMMEAHSLAPLDNWPEEYRSPEWEKWKSSQDDQLRKMSHVYAQEGILSSEGKTPLHFLISTLIHDGWMHFFGNIMLLILLGSWVEQKFKGLQTGLIFFIGSFAGFLLQMTIEGDRAVLGASAGVSALMGAFYMSFWRAELRFIFLPYYAKLTMPVIWTFPALFFVQDFTSALSGARTGVAYWCHIGGLIFGMVYAWFYKKQEGLSQHQYFVEEIDLEEKLNTARDSRALWIAFSDLMRWNCQNRPAIRLYLQKTAKLGMPENKAIRKKIDDWVTFSSKHVMKKGSIEEVKEWLSLVGGKIDFKVCLRSVPLKQVLLYADNFAMKGDLATSFRLYKCALTMKPNRETKQSIDVALKTIIELNEEKQRERSLQTATPA